MKDARTIRAIAEQIEAMYRSEYARALTDAALTGVPDNGAKRGRAIDAQETAKRYYEHARSLAEPMLSIPTHRMIAVTLVAPPTVKR